MEKNITYTLAHVGINCSDPEQAQRLSALFEGLFSWNSKEGTSSFFAGKEIECTKKPYLGEKGHIAIGTPDVDAAMAQLKGKGIRFAEETQKKDAAGATKAVYLEGQYGGFAVHLLRV